jgi:hypothetical protein
MLQNTPTFPARPGPWRMFDHLSLLPSCFTGDARCYAVAVRMRGWDSDVGEGWPGWLGVGSCMASGGGCSTLLRRGCMQGGEYVDRVRGQERNDWMHSIYSLTP